LDLAALAALMEARRQAAVATAQTAADAADAAAAALMAAASHRVADAEARIPQAQAALDAADGRLTQAESDLADTRHTLTAVAVEAFSNIGSSSDTVMNMQERLLQGSARSDEVSHVMEYSQAASKALTAQMEQASRHVDQARVERHDAQSSLDAVNQELAEAREAVANAAATAASVHASGQAAVAAAALTGEVPLAMSSSGPTVLGPSVVSSDDMAAFVQARGHPDASIDMKALASLYLSEGAAEGVRGDIAFVQSIIETGYFSFANSMVDVSDHNYAGIGACDSCTDGFGYPTPQDGVRAQIQLLRTYATKGLTADQLAHPPVRSAPEKSSVRGCCDTWMSLAGVWASATNYGVSILTLYNSMLQFAASRQSPTTTPASTAPPG
jgi:hypothetical protein